jgi:protein-tyrosine phosphatase
MTVRTGEERDIALEVAYNVRHLGGYRTHGGRQTSDSIIRAGNLSRLTPVGVERLRDLGVRTVVDLRSLQEQTEKPAPGLAAAGIRVVSAPVYKDDPLPADALPEWITTVTVYQRSLQAGMAAFRTLFETISESQNSVLFNCNAGKDRTGIGAALLLDFAGVDRADIATDFSRSAELLDVDFTRWRLQWTERGWHPDLIAQLLSSNAEDMAATLDYISARWGSSEGYLAAAGLSETARSAVRARIVA